MLHTVTEYLRRSAKLYPDRTALVDGRGSVPYSVFLKEAEQVAGGLVQLKLFKSPVAVMMDKSAQAVIAFFGVALSGNFYTVIDTKMPEPRVRKILETFQPKLMITDRKNSGKAEAAREASGMEVLYFEDMAAAGLDHGQKEEIEKAGRRMIDTDILYVLFTSGSTGTPKGVIITHRSVIDYTEWAAETFGFNQNTVIGNQAPFYFDNSVLDIYSAVRNGAAMYIIPQTLYAFPIRLLEYIRDNRINTVFWVPTVLSRIADLGVLDKCDIGCLKHVLFAGEVMPAKQLNIWMRRLPGAVFANLYGPTEITVDCTCYIVDREIPDNEPVPIGRPCTNSDILVLNGKNKLVSAGEKGELCVRGSSLSLGYYNSPEKTAEAFVQNPLNAMYHELIYRTGDIVHYNERGELIYDGRADSQVKHTGHRIELGEIETNVSAIEGVTRNCCMHRADTDQLILFYTGDIREDQLRKVLSGSLPEYMLPNVCVHLLQMPLNMNGKIDRAKLKDGLLGIKGENDGTV